MTALFRVALVSALSSAASIVLGSESLAVDVVCWVSVQLTVFAWCGRQFENEFEREGVEDA